MDNESAGQVFRNVDGSAVAASVFQANPRTDAHVLENVGWLPNFDSTRLDYASCGIIPGFPHPTPRLNVARTMDGVVLEWRNGGFPTELLAGDTVLGLDSKAAASQTNIDGSTYLLKLRPDAAQSYFSLRPYLR